METKVKDAKVKDSDERILIRIADKLVLAQQELDELVLQFSLGKADAKDKFEEIKHEFRDRVREFKNLTTSQQVDEMRQEFSEIIDEVEEMLKKGTAQSVEAFEKQKNQLEHALDQLKKYANKHMPNTLDLGHFSHDLEKFKLKLEILRLAFKLKKLEVKDSFKEKMHEIKKGIEHTISNTKEKMKMKKSKVSVFRKEAHDVYVQMKKAIAEL